MPEWLIILIVFFVVSRFVRHGRYRGHFDGRRRGLRGPRYHRSVGRGPERAVPPPKVETPMEALQRRYVEGSITVEEYEAELDKLYRS